MATADIEALLAARLGFDSETVGGLVVAHAVEKAMAETGASDLAAYARRIVHDTDAWETLVDRVIVPETSFFRDGTPFELVREIAQARWRLTPGRTLRVLSCPCSTGEEPYSLALALLDSGAAPDSFAVRAVDVSRRAVHAARAARFPANSFRGADLSYRDRYFHRADKGGWQVNDVARAHVTVEQCNILAPDFLGGETPFDIVFCRNLMIYLHPPAKALVMAAVRRVLAPGGVLFVGHAEAGIARQHGFSTMGRAGTFAFTDGGNERPAAPARLPRPAPAPPPPTRITARPAARAVQAARPEPDSSLARARELADAGRLDEALGVCTAHLERLPDSADGHFLMGVLRDAMGERGLAALSLKKALYLDPRHLPALKHLALTREAAGDPAGAALLRDRARRAASPSGGK